MKFLVVLAFFAVIAAWFNLLNTVCFDDDEDQTESPEDVLW